MRDRFPDGIIPKWQVSDDKHRPSVRQVSPNLKAMHSGYCVMPSAPLNQRSATDLQVPDSETVEQRFRRLESKWRAETGHLSSPSAVINHAAFREIIGIGEAVVPLMLRDLAERPGLWVWALPEITRTNPLGADDHGKIARMSEAGVPWGREQGYLP